MIDSYREFRQKLTIEEFRAGVEREAKILSEDFRLATEALKEHKKMLLEDRVEDTG